jgi:hypothetical protein
VWAQVKREVAKKKNYNGKSWKINERRASQGDTRRLGVLRKTCRITAGGRFCKRNRRDEILEPIFINLQDSETEDEESDEDDSDVTGAGGRYDDDDGDDSPLVVPLD